MSKLTDLAELSICDEQRAESLETISSLACILFSIVLSHGDIGSLRIARSDLLGLPDKVLKQLAVVLRQQQLLGLVDDIAQVLHKDLAFGRQLLVRGRESLGVQGGVEGNIALLVLLRCEGVMFSMMFSDGMGWDTSETNRGELAILKSYMEVMSDCDDSQMMDCGGQLTMEDSKQLKLLVDILGATSYQ